jgi:hypothetical protein
MGRIAMVSLLWIAGVSRYTVGNANGEKNQVTATAALTADPQGLAHGHRTHRPASETTRRAGPWKN